MRCLRNILPLRRFLLPLAVFLLFLPGPLPATAQTNQHQGTAVPAKLVLPEAMQAELHRLQDSVNAAPEGPEKIRWYGKICWFYLGQPQLDLARLYADTVRLLATKWKDEAGKIKALYYYGVLARQEGNYPAALPYLEQYLRYHQQAGDSSKVAGVLYQLGAVHSHLGNFEKSLAAYYRSLVIEAADSNWYSVGYTLNTIGIVQKETGKFATAEKSFLKALHIFDSLDEKKDRTDVLVNLGNLYTQTGRWKEGRQRYLEALHISRQIQRRQGEAYALANLAFLFDGQGQYDSALVYHLNALALRRTLPGKEELARSLIGTGRGYRQVKQYALAKPYLLQALSLVTEIGAKPMLRDVFDNLAEVAAQEGNFKQAYRYQQLYSAIKDSVLNEETARQLTELQTKYETSEKDRQISLLENEKELQQKEVERQVLLKKVSVGGLLLVSLLALLVVYVFRQRMNNQKLIEAKNNEIREVNFKRQLAELEMKALRAQINPHFLFNCMNSINRMILNGDMDRASLYLTKFSKLVRQILENSEAAVVSLNSELALLEAYIQLEELRFKGRIRHLISVDESIEPENTCLPSMVLQPFVENAIWHGLMHKENGAAGFISIAIKEENDRLLCTIEDNGVGRERSRQLGEKALLKRNSLGVKITEERLRLLAPKGSGGEVRITDLKDTQSRAIGTRVELSIPLC